MARGRITNRAGVSSARIAGTGDYLDVANIAELAALPSAGFDEGERVWMRSLLDEWTLENAGVDAFPSDPILYIPALGKAAGWYWVRACLPHGSWQVQQTWHVDELAGDDENDGTAAGAANALASYDEINRRVAGRFRATPITVTFDANYTGSIDAWNDGDPDHVTGVELFIETAETIIQAGIVVSALQASSTAGNVQCNIASAASVPVSWTASGWVDQQYVMTSGAYAGYAGWVVTDLGAKTARITEPCTHLNDVGLPAVNDTLKIVSYKTLSGNITTRGGGFVYVTKAILTGSWESFARFTSQWACNTNTAGSTFGGVFNVLAGGRYRSAGASTANLAEQFTLGAVYLLLGLVISGGQYSGLLRIANAVSGGSVTIRGEQRVILEGDSIVGGADLATGLFFVAVANPIALVYDAYLDLTQAIPFGTGTGDGISLKQSRANLLATKLPAITGLTNQLVVDGVPITFAALAGAEGFVSGAGSVATIDGAAVPVGALATQNLMLALRAGAARR